MAKGTDRKKKENPIAKFFKVLGNDIKDIGVTFAKGDWKTKVSFLIMGFGQLLRGQVLRGIMYLAVEAGIICYMIFFGWQYLSKFTTLGTTETDTSGRITVYGDNSFLILLFGILSIMAVIALIFMWRLNVRENANQEKLLKAGKKLPGNKADIMSLFDSNFDKTLLALPVVGIFVFTVLPIVFMICVAFTNYDATHQAPSKLFTWVGLENFKNLFSFSSTGFGGTFVQVLIWTIVWAFLATFIDYFLGIAVAMLINRKGIRFKKVWRTFLVMTIAVPQFVSLLYVSKLFDSNGLINGTLLRLGIIQEAIPFWTNPILAKVMIVVINIWIGIPYLMLIATGLLMNIPEDLYESARIDGASPWQMFKSITLPYMLFVTGPFLLTQFTGNLNNFNVIFLLSGGGPKTGAMVGGAGKTDLLVTWLYKMTINDTNYKMAAVIGIMVFVVTAGISLVVYQMLPSVKDEEGFQ